MLLLVFLFRLKFDHCSNYLNHVSCIPHLQIAAERERVTMDPKAIMPAAFVSFKSRWAAAVCAQTQQSRDPTSWLTEWAPEPRDVYWPNLAIPYVQLTIKRLIIVVAFFFLTTFFMIPITFVQTLANIEGIEKALPPLKVIIEMWVLYTKWYCHIISLIGTSVIWIRLLNKMTCFTIVHLTFLEYPFMNYFNTCFYGLRILYIY